ncbi:unnamed protein product [Closterium sp. Naga37s-1]|nr:unnamed protein product [Closterium sp. Naga37s-1]
MPRVRQPGGAVLVRASTSAAESSPLFLGFDFGTSGARAVVIDGNAAILADVKRKYPPAAHAESASESAVGVTTDPDDDVSAAEGWRAALFGLLRDIPEELRRRVAAVSLDGTSATTMVVSRTTREPVACPMMYNEAGSAEAVAAVAAVAPANHTTTAGTSTLCKLMTWWLKQGGEKGEESGEGERGGRGGGGGEGEGEGEVVMVHQADWLLGQLCGAADVHVTDFNNALKLGYDPESSAYPDWLLALPFAPMLPRVLPPGSLIGTVGAHLTAEFALPSDCIVTTGTTDSIAAFLAARVTTPGYAVTSLGSTLAVKLVSTARIDDARFGVYSHRLPPGNWAPPEAENDGGAEQGGVAEEDKECKWLVGGASNTGGAVLREHFTDEQLRELSAKIDPSVESKLDYYPLTRPGERFPVSDPDLQPRQPHRIVSEVDNSHLSSLAPCSLTPRPADDALFLHGTWSCSCAPTHGIRWHYQPITGSDYSYLSSLAPCSLTPRPADDALFLHGILESIATIEVSFYYSLPCARHFLVSMYIKNVPSQSLFLHGILESIATIEVRPCSPLPCPVTRFLVPSLACLPSQSLFLHRILESIATIEVCLCSPLPFSIDSAPFLSCYSHMHSYKHPDTQSLLSICYSIVHATSHHARSCDPLLPSPTNSTQQARAYSLLADLGASPPVKRVYTAGGGAGNPTWSAIRERVMGVPVAPSGNTDAAFGSALLAREGFLRRTAK